MVEMFMWGLLLIGWLLSFFGGNSTATTVITLSCCLVGGGYFGIELFKLWRSSTDTP